jgi:streptogramin lyase
MPSRPKRIVAGGASIWVIFGASAKALKQYSAETGIEQVTVAFGSVWITGTGNDELYRVDPATNQIIATIELQSSPRMLVAGEDSIWVFNEGDRAVQRIDGNSGKIITTIETGTGRPARAPVPRRGR